MYSHVLTSGYCVCTRTMPLYKGTVVIIDLLENCGEHRCLFRVSVKVKWGKEKYDDIDLESDEAPLLFKNVLFSLSGVSPERMKLMIKGQSVKVVHLKPYSRLSQMSRWCDRTMIGARSSYKT